MKPWFYRFCLVVLGAMVNWFFRITHRGGENIPTSGATIVASNHLSPWDGFTTPKVINEATATGRFTRCLVKDVVFRRQPAKWFMFSLGHIPVERDVKGGGVGLENAEAALRDDEGLLLVYPEGTISPTFVPMRPYHGTARMAIATGAAVVPMGIWGTHRSATKYRKRDLVRKRPVHMVFGEPMSFEPDADLGEATDAIMNAIIECTIQARNEYPEAPGEDDWWGPPVWPEDKLGKWRPKIERGTSDEDARELALKQMLSS